MNTHIVEAHAADPRGIDMTIIAAMNVLLAIGRMGMQSPLAMAEHVGYSVEFIVAIYWNLYVGGRLCRQKYDSSFWVWQEGRATYADELKREAECACNFRSFNSHGLQVDAIAVLQGDVLPDFTNSIWASRKQQ